MDSAKGWRCRRFRKDRFLDTHPQTVSYKCSVNCLRLDSGYDPLCPAIHAQVQSGDQRQSAKSISFNGVHSVGPYYFKAKPKPITIKISDFDETAPGKHWTHQGRSLNYAMSLHAIMAAHEEGYTENMYLDAATRTKVEETGGVTHLFAAKKRIKNP